MSGETGSLLLWTRVSIILLAALLTAWIIWLSSCTAFAPYWVRPYLTPCSLPHFWVRPHQVEFAPSWVMSKWVALCRKLQRSKNQDKFWMFIDRRPFWKFICVWELRRPETTHKLTGNNYATVEPWLSGPQWSGFFDYPDFFSGPNFVLNIY